MGGEREREPEWDAEKKGTAEMQRKFCGWITWIVTEGKYVGVRKYMMTEVYDPRDQLESAVSRVDTSAFLVWELALYQAHVKEAGLWLCLSQRGVIAAQLFLFLSH